MRWLGWILLGSALAAAVPGCQGKAQRQGQATSDGVPAVYGKTLEGRYVHLEDFKGRVVLVNVWATWCKPCRQELPTLEALHREYDEQGFTVLGVSTDGEEDEPQVRSMVEQFELSYPILLDPESRSVSALQVTGFPTSVLVGRKGTISWRHDGLLQPDDPTLMPKLRAALAAPQG